MKISSKNIGSVNIRYMNIRSMNIRSMNIRCMNINSMNISSISAQSIPTSVISLLPTSALFSKSPLTIALLTSYSQIRVPWRATLQVPSTANNYNGLSGFLAPSFKFPDEMLMANNTYMIMDRSVRDLLRKSTNFPRSTDKELIILTPLGCFVSNHINIATGEEFSKYSYRFYCKKIVENYMTFICFSQIAFNNKMEFNNTDFNKMNLH